MFKVKKGIISNILTALSGILLVKMSDWPTIYLTHLKPTTCSSLIILLLDDWKHYKLDGVGPLITDPQPISFTTLSKKRRKKGDMWRVTCDMWHITCNTWHATCDMWYVTCCGGWTLYQNFSSLALLDCDLWNFED